MSLQKRRKRRTDIWRSSTYAIPTFEHSLDLFTSEWYRSLYQSDSRLLLLVGKQLQRQAAGHRLLLQATDRTQKRNGNHARFSRQSISVFCTSKRAIVEETNRQVVISIFISSMQSTLDIQFSLLPVEINLICKFLQSLSSLSTMSFLSYLIGSDLCS